jgi:ribonuclease T2
MKKIIISSIIVALPLIAMSKKVEVYQNAIKSCPAYNNMKHTTNTNGIKLKIGNKYKILDHKKGQILTLIKGERIAQRWVDEACFSTTKSTSKSPIKTTLKRSKQNLLAISWQNAFCQTHQYKKECKSMKRGDFASSHFVLHGLWPQPRNNQYCNIDKKQIGMDKNKQWNRLNRLDLTPKVREDLKKYMTGYSSNLHLHEWVKHGSCYGMDANKYYKDAINLLTQVNNSKVRTYFVKHIGQTIKLKDIRKIFDSEFGNGAGEHVTMNCNRGLITELWLHIGSQSDKLEELLSKGETPKSRCFKGRVDEVGF